MGRRHYTYRVSQGRPGRGYPCTCTYNVMTYCVRVHARVCGSMHACMHNCVRMHNNIMRARIISKGYAWPHRSCMMCARSARASMGTMSRHAHGLRAKIAGTGGTVALLRGEAFLYMYCLTVVLGTPRTCMSDCGSSRGHAWVRTGGQLYHACTVDVWRVLRT